MAENKGKRIYVWAIVGLLFVGLLGFGAGGLSGTIRTIGTVGDKPISVASYQGAVNQQIRAFEAQVRTPVSFVQAQTLGLDQQALNAIVASRALDNEVSNLGLSVGDTRVREELLQVPAFRGLSGGFDREQYRSALQRSGQTETDFETGIREDTARTLLQAAVLGGVPASDTYVDTLTAFIGEQRAITWARLDAEQISAPIPGATDADIATFYDENPDVFTAPEQRNITYVWLTPAMIQDDVTVDETSIRALYDERIAEFVRPERRLVERLGFLDDAAVADAKARLDAGELTFDALVEERGLALADIDLGDVLAGELGAAGDAVFAAEPGAVVGPFPTSFGPALFRMNAILAADETSYEEARAELREELSAQRAIRVIDQAREGVSDLLAGGARLEDLADQSDLVLGTIAWDNSMQDDIAAYDAFRAAAGTIEVGAFPELQDLDDGGVFVLRLDDVTPPALRPLEDVSEDVAVAWQIARTQQAVMEEAQAAADEIQPLTGFETLALTPETQDGLTRRSFVDGTPPGFMQRVFELSSGEVTVIDAGTFAVIVRVDSITQADATDPQLSADRQVLFDGAAAGIAQDIFNIFNNEIQTNTDVSLDQAAINAVHTSFR